MVSGCVLVVVGVSGEVVLDKVSHSLPGEAANALERAQNRLQTDSLVLLWVTLAGRTLHQLGNRARDPSTSKSMLSRVGGPIS